jgi:hypothetical protein
MRSRRVVARRAVWCIVGLWATVAHGQQNTNAPLGDGFGIDRMTPTPAGDRFTFVPEPRIQARLSEALPAGCVATPTPSCDSAISWVAWKAVTSFQRIDISEGKSANISRLHLGTSWSPLSYAQLSLDIPLNLYQTDLPTLSKGYGPTSASRRVGLQPEVFDIGDIRIATRFAWPLTAWFQWGLQGQVFFATGDHERLTGDRTFARFDMLTLVGVYQKSPSSVSYTIAAYAGICWHEKLIASDLRLRPGAKLGLAGSFDSIFGWNYLMPVVEAKMDQIGQGSPVPWDVSLGGRFRAMPNKPWWITALATAGLSKAPGIPTYAFILDITFIPWNF